MPHVHDEVWKQLCEEATTEKDPEKLLELVQEINRLIDEKRLGLHGKEADSKPLATKQATKTAVIYTAT